MVWVESHCKIRFCLNKSNFKSCECSPIQHVHDSCLARRYGFQMKIQDFKVSLGIMSKFLLQINGTNWYYICTIWYHKNWNWYSHGFRDIIITVPMALQNTKGTYSWKSWYQNKVCMNWNSGVCILSRFHTFPLSPCCY